MARAAFLFPGQGAQYVGMAKSLCESLPAASALFGRAADLLGYDLLAVCADGPADLLNSTVISQPAIFVASLAALESLRATHPDAENDCVATAGLSLGEYTALVFSGVLGFEDGLRVVQLRGEAMQAAADATPSGMVSLVGPELARVEELVAAARTAVPGETLQIANYLCPGNTVASGGRAACEALERLAGEAGARTIRLAVAGAFHTPLMRPADQRLASALSGVTFKPPRVPVWSNVDARPHTDPEEMSGLLVRQVLQPVLWEGTLRGLLEAGCDKFYEIGPGRVLAGLLKRVQRKAECVNVAA
jgi:[acyl-carrier-protein] S-malonyltransferase